MAGVTSTLRLNDMMTSVLRRINRSMSITIDSFEAVQRASGQAFDDQSILAARREIDLANRELDAMADHYNRIGRQQEQFNRSVTHGSSAVDGLTSKLKGAVGAALGMAGVKNAFDLSDTMTSTTARLSMVDDGGNVDALKQKIFASAQDSRGAYQATADSVAKLGLTAGEAFTSNDEIIAFAEQVNKQFTIAGTSASGMDAAWLQLTQAMGSGVLRGEEYNSILEQAPNIIQSIAKYMDVPKGKLKDMAAEGKITADIVKNAMFAAADETNSKFNAMPKTFAQVFQSVKNEALMIFQPVLKKLSELASSERFQTAINGVLNSLAVMAEMLLNIMEFAGGVAVFIQDNWSVIEPIIMGIAAALLVYGAYLAVTKGALAIATAAQWLFNSGMLACPLTWFLVGIVALVAALGMFTNNMNSAYGLTLSFGGMLAGSVMVIFAAFGNLIIDLVNAFLFLGNVGVGCWEVLKAVVQNIYVAFNNAICGVQAWFYGLLSTVLTVVAGVCEALNKIPFVNIDYSGIESKANEYAAKEAEANNAKMEYADVGAAFQKGMNSIDYLNRIDYGEAFDAGYYWGDNAFGGTNIEDQMSGALGGFAGDTAADYLSEISENTGEMANCGDKTSEELAYLRDIAEQEAINRFTTAQVKVDFTSNNNISSDVDVDGITEQFTREFTAALETAAEGVY